MANKLIYSKKDLDHCMEVGIKLERSRTVELLESGEHVWQVEFNKRFFGPAWKQKCRCGFYGVFNEHLVALIKEEK